MRAPITSRTLLYDTFPDGTKRLLDFALVGTSIGAMIEPRTLVRNGGAITAEDVYDIANFNDIQPVDETMRGQFSLNSTQWPVSTVNRGITV